MKISVKRIGIWGKYIMALNKVGLYMLLTAFFSVGWVSTADAYVLSGTVTNNSGKTGCTYLFVNHSTGHGTSITTSGVLP
jgi:hypothetical protein